MDEDWDGEYSDPRSSDHESPDIEQDSPDLVYDESSSRDEFSVTPD